MLLKHKYHSFIRPALLEYLAYREKPVHTVRIMFLEEDNHSCINPTLLEECCLERKTILLSVSHCYKYVLSEEYHSIYQSHTVGNMLIREENHSFYQFHKVRNMLLREENHSFISPTWLEVCFFDRKTILLSVSHCC